MVADRRPYAIEITDYYQSVGDGEKVLTETSITGTVDVGSQDRSKLEGNLVLKLQDGRSLPFYFQDIISGTGTITPNGSLK